MPTDHVDSRGTDDNGRPAVVRATSATVDHTMRSYLGAVDQRDELEPTTTEESSTQRLNMTISTQMYYILVMMETMYRCHNAGVNEGFAGMIQGEPRFVGLLRNEMSCRRKDDIPTHLPADEELSTTGDCDRRHYDTCECGEDGGPASQGLSHPGKHKDRELDTGAKGNPRDHENTTVR